MSELAREAFIVLYPNRDVNSYKLTITYNNRFKDYGANVRYSLNKIDFKLSKKWQGVNNTITTGLLHELFIKIFRTKNPHTLFYVDLYNSFVKNMHIAAPKNEFDLFLKESFERVNDKYFFAAIDMPNLLWGNKSKRKLGTYDFCTDTIKMNPILRNKEQFFLDYVMYHEMLHKHLKFDSSNGRSRFHNKEFRRRERMFENAEIIEKAINNGFRMAKKASVFSDFFFKTK